MNREGADVESPFPLFFSFSASFKNSSPREKVAKLSSFWDCSVLSIRFEVGGYLGTAPAGVI